MKILVRNLGRLKAFDELILFFLNLGIERGIIRLKDLRFRSFSLSKFNGNDGNKIKTSVNINLWDFKSQ